MNVSNLMSFNDFSSQPYLPYQIISVLVKDTSQEAEDFWKCLKYATENALDNDNLTVEEKLNLIWTNQTDEENYNVFMKPLVGSSLNKAQSQQQLRIYRYTTTPTNRLSAVICFEADFITSEKTAMVYYNGILCERTDLMESLFLKIFNGKDVGVGSGYLSFDREISRSSNSTFNINNSVSLFGRSLILCLQYTNITNGDTC